MGQDNNQQSPQTGTVPEWFTPVGSTPTPPLKPKKSPKFLLIIGGAILLLGVIAVTIVTLARQPSTCLDASDYKALTGIDVADDLSPAESFYDSYTLFNDGTTTYDNTTDGGLYGESLLQKIADFYKSHSAKSMLITISAAYVLPENESITNQRIATVRSSLLKAGVPESTVVIVGATYVAPEDSIDGNGDTGEISISITSDTTCTP